MSHCLGSQLDCLEQDCGRAMDAQVDAFVRGFRVEILSWELWSNSELAEHDGQLGTTLPSTQVGIFGVQTFDGPAIRYPLCMQDS